MTPELNRLTVLPRELGQLMFITDLDPLPLIGPTEAAQLLNLARHTLACYRHLGDGPAYYKFGRWIRYAPEDLRRWHDGAAALRGLAQNGSESEVLRLVTPAIAAQFLTVTLPCLRNYRLEGVGPRYLRYSNRIYYPVHELLAWAEGRRYPAGASIRRARQGCRNS